MRKNIVETICILFVLLFVYTAISKVLDYENFRAVIGQSPIVTKFAGLFSVLVPLIEVTISVLLIINKTRQFALYATFSLMILFTVYIYTLVTFSEKIPCTCGGVIQKMSWKQHIAFNLFFVLLSIIAIFFNGRKNMSGGNISTSKVSSSSIY